MSGIGMPSSHVPPQHSAPKITAQQREEIRRRYQDGESATEMAKEFGVSVRLIRDYGGGRHR